MKSLVLSKIKILPFLILCIPWIVMIIIYYYGPFMYRPFTFQTWLYLAGALSAVMFGYFVGWQTAKVKKVVRHIPEPVFKIIQGQAFQLQTLLMIH
jgi:hypothetical protein